MSDAAIAARLQEILSATFPGWPDRSEDPAPVAEARLPAFALAVDRESAVPLSMSSPEEEVTASAIIALFVKGPDPRSEAKAARDKAQAAIRAAGDLGGLVFYGPIFASSAIELASGESRIARVDLRYSMSFIS